VTEEKHQKLTLAVSDLLDTPLTSDLFPDPSPATEPLDLDSKLSPSQACDKGLNAFFNHHQLDALKLFQQAVKDNYLPAKIFLGMMFKEGRGVRKDIEFANLCFTEVFDNIEWFRPETQNNPIILYSLGHLCLASEYKSIKGKRAFDFFETAANLNYIPALTGLAYCYRAGIHITKDELKGHELYTMAAVRGDVYALEYLSEKYFAGVDVPQDTKKAISYLQLSAKTNAKAQRRLGAYYIEGTAVPKDTNKGFEYIKRAADKGYEYAQFDLGVAYLFGEDIDKDPIRAVSLLQKLIEQEFLAALHWVGEFYYYGIGVRKDVFKAVAFYSRAAELGRIEDHVRLGYCYLDGQGLPQDAKKAVELFIIAAKQGSAKGQDALAYCYSKGFGVAKDVNQAIYWNSLAATEGEDRVLKNFKFLTEIDYSQYIKRRADVTTLLTQLSIFGTTNANAKPLYAIVTDYLGPDETKEVTTNSKEEQKFFGLFWNRSANLYRVLANRGISDAQYELALCYLKGSGVELNIKEAARYFYKAAELGHKKAAAELNKLVVEKVSLYKTMAELGFSRGQFLLGKCYEQGDGVPKDTIKANFWYQKAAQPEQSKGQATLPSINKY
jgi:hypothetical protein